MYFYFDKTISFLLFLDIVRKLHLDKLLQFINTYKSCIKRLLNFKKKKKKKMKFEMK